MVIVELMWGLGNQMFQYALFRALLEKGKNAKININSCDVLGAGYGYELSKIFCVKEIFASKDEYTQLGDMKTDIINRVRRNLFSKKKSLYAPTLKEEASFISKVFEKENVYLRGYWQSFKYFEDIEGIIKHEFTFKNELDQANKKLVDKIQNCNSISIHVRHGDYLNSTNLGIIPVEYYQKSFEFTRDKFKDSKYFIFSDDIPWCRENLRFINGEYIDINKGFDGYKDMQLMSLCKHNIIANSSFSWWGAWLNKNPYKNVIAPRKHFYRNNIKIEDRFPDSWLQF